MEISNEKLALLYNEAKDSRSKEKIFIKLKNNLQKKTNKIINFWISKFSESYEIYDDFQTYKQIADMVLVNTLNIFMGTNSKFNLEKWYVERLKNNLFDINEEKINKDNYEIFMNFQEENLENIISNNNYDNVEQKIYNEYLYDVIKSHIDKIEFFSKGKKPSSYYKEMFLESIGFNTERLCKSYAELAEKNNCTRQNVRDFCTRYMKKLAESLKKDNNIEVLRQYL